MFGIGGTELLVIFIVALLVLGPQSLPKIAKTLGKTLGEFRRVSTEFQRTLNAEADEEEKHLNQRSSAQTPSDGAENKDRSGKGHSA